MEQILIPSRQLKNSIKRDFDKLRTSKHKSSKNYFEHALYLLDRIHTRHYIQKNIVKGEAVPMNYNRMKALINDRKLKVILQYLIDNKYITTNGYYKASETSKEYAINYDKVGSQNWLKYILKDNKLISNIDKEKQNRMTQELKLDKGYQVSLYWNKELELNTRKARKHLPELYARSKDIGNSAEHSLVNWEVQDISNNYMWVKDTFGNRLHTRLTSLKSDFRKYLTIDSKPLGQVDISNSQPLFLYLLMKEDKRINKEEIERFGELVLNGKFYSGLAEALDVDYTKENKAKIKEGLFQVWYGGIKSEKDSLTDTYIAFKSLFPDILKYVNHLKRDYYKDCCQLMQRTEADFIFKSVTRIDKELGYHKVPLLTIHDSIVTTLDNLDLVTSLLIECFQDLYNVKPIITPEIF